MALSIEKNDLMFHSAHGLCRVATISRSEKNELSYIFLPIENNRAKIRFVIPQKSLEDSGFNKLISDREAEAVLAYFKTRGARKAKTGHAWVMAELISSEAFNKKTIKDTRVRQKIKTDIHQSVYALTKELAFVLKTDAKKVVETIQKNLGNISAMNPVVAMAFDAISEE